MPRSGGVHERHDARPGHARQRWIAASYQGACVDAGAPPPPPDPFANAPAFASRVAGSSHNPGQDCMSHHDHGFTFAGTLFDANGLGLAGAEVRILDANGNAFSIYTGPEGNFRTSTSWSGQAHVGARNATGKALMVTAIPAPNVGCNGCHASGATVAPIHLP